MRIIGLDLSLAGTGMADNQGRIRHLTRGKSGRKDSLTGYDRLRYLRAHVAEFVLLEHTGLVVIEDMGPVGGNNAKTLVGKVKLHALIEMFLVDYGIPFALVNPSHLKKFATGRGDSKKDDMRLALYKRHSLEFKSNDEIDAYFLMVMGAIRFSELAGIPSAGSRATKESLTMLDKVSWPIVRAE